MAYKISITLKYTDNIPMNYDTYNIFSIITLFHIRMIYDINDNTFFSILLK